MDHGLRHRISDARREELAAAAVVVLALLLAPFITGPSQTRLLITIILFAVFSTAFNLLYGYTGLLSFGHAMFIVVAAYTAAKVFRRVGTSDAMEATFGGAQVLASFGLALVAGVLAAAIVGVVIGYLCVQREEIYFALLTLSFSMALWAIFQQDILGQVARGAGGEGFTLFNTGGSDGLPVSFRLLGDVDLFGLQFELVNINDYYAYYFTVLLISALAIYLMWRLIQSPFGETCKAIRENPGRAEALGIDRTYHSWMAFVISGTFSGLVGAMIVPLRGGALPNLAHWSFSAFPVVMTVIGGPYAFLGPAAGAFVFEFVRELIAQFPVLEERWQLVFGVILLGVVLYFENGVAGGLERLRSRVAGGEAEAAEGAPTAEAGPESEAERPDD
jgi:branched-chain amino acid transport system permease protein